MAGLTFDDLIPEGQPAKGAVSFDDLIPAGAAPKKENSNLAKLVTGEKITPEDPGNSVTGAIDAFGRGAANMGLFGFGDEIGAGLDYAGSHIVPWREPKTFDQALADTRGDDARVAAAHPVANVAGEVTGVVGGMAGLAKMGLSPTLKAIKAGVSLPKVAAISSGEGLALGGLQGFGNGEGLENRLENGATGAIGGGVIGGLAPLAVAGISKAAAPLIAPIGARLFPGRYAQSAIGEGVRRSGMTVDDIADSLSRAGADDQGMFTVADAMGNSGQRMLSTVVRNPNDARQGVVDALLGRQMDQGRRVAGALQDASGTRLTAAQYEQALRAERAADAGRNYAPVTTDISAIDVSPAVAVANRAISPAADHMATATGAVPTDLAARSSVEAGEAAIRDPIRQALKEARSYIASDTLTVTNVEKAFRAKTNMDAMIAKATENGQGAMVDQLTPIRNALDDALARTSSDYASARDSYRVASQPIEAVATGRGMAAPRTRTQDNLATFGAMDAPSQDAARVGYFDPMIAKAESAAGAMTNSARPFMSDSMRRELPVFAADGQAPMLGRRLGREARMSETAGAALGGSKTADNLADAAEMAKFDPGVMSALMRADIPGALMAGARRLVSEGSGTPPRVIEQIGHALMQTDPVAAREVLNGGLARLSRSDALRARVVSALTNLGASGSGRVAAP